MSDLVAMVSALADAKKAEDAAKLARIAAEEALIDALEFTKSEGQESFDLTSATGAAKVVLKQPINRTVDSDEWVNLRKTLPKSSPARKCFKAKYSLDTKAMKKLAEEDDLTYRYCMQAVTAKPGKVSVTVKELIIGEVKV